jgi:hypothetical protein
MFGYTTSFSIFAHHKTCNQSNKRKQFKNPYKRAMMALKLLTCIKAPEARPILTQGHLFEQIW